MQKNIYCVTKSSCSQVFLQQIFSTTAKKLASADYLLHFLIPTIRMSWSVTNVGLFKHVRKASSQVKSKQSYLRFSLKYRPVSEN